MDNDIKEIANSPFSEPMGRRASDRLSSLEEKFILFMAEKMVESQLTNAKLDALVEALRVNEESAKELLTLFGNVKGAFKLLAWLEKPAVWLAKIGAAAGILWALWKFVVFETISRGGPK